MITGVGFLGAGTIIHSRSDRQAEHQDRAIRLQWLIEREDTTGWLYRQLETVTELNL